MSANKEHAWFRPVRAELLRELTSLVTASKAHSSQGVASALGKALLTDAVREGASDIHITPQTGCVQLRFRVDGALVDVASLSTEDGMRILRYFKTAGELPAGTAFRPQDARMTFGLEKGELDLRLATAPCIAGEKLAIRILDPNRIEQRIGDLGLRQDDRDQIGLWLGRVSGMFLVAGPTGSGKSTTLYALLHELKFLERSVVTVEDPVEYRVDGTAQMQIDIARGLTFAAGLKAMLRLDPDYLLLGEIRDPESAQAAVGAASAGRGLLSTLHSRDAVGVVTALRNWDLQDFEIAAALEMVVAQRLVRKLCPHCRRLEAPRQEEAQWLESLRLPVPERTWHAGQCDRCRGIGFSGRTGVFEIWALNKEDYHRILTHDDERSLRENLARQGFHSLLADGLDMVAEGVTSLDELRMVGSFFLPPEGCASAQLIERLAATIGGDG